MLLLLLLLLLQPLPRVRGVRSGACVAARHERDDRTHRFRAISLSTQHVLVVWTERRERDPRRRCVVVGCDEGAVAAVAAAATAAIDVTVIAIVLTMTVRILIIITFITIIAIIIAAVVEIIVTRSSGGMRRYWQRCERSSLSRWCVANVVGGERCRWRAAAYRARAPLRLRRAVNDWVRVTRSRRRRRRYR